MTPAPKPRPRTKSPELMVRAYPNADAVPARPQLNLPRKIGGRISYLEPEARADPAQTPAGSGRARTLRVYPGRPHAGPDSVSVT
jgi:hypothetical protein